MNVKPITAAVLVIGDEILSGRTQDTNTNYIAKFLGTLGIDLREARVVPDIEDEIVAALNALRARYTYVFTTGGIGPTHDDITADAIAKAFGVGIDYHPEALAILGARYKNPEDFNDMRKRMARVPDGAELIRNSVSIAPGFRIGNVERGAVVHAITISTRLPEGRIAAALASIQGRFVNVAIGSYPFYREEGFGVQLVARGRDLAAVEGAADAIEAMLRAEGDIPERLKN
jgi:molybdenum cofactor synthesis domain-containing protein